MFNIKILKGLDYELGSYKGLRNYIYKLESPYELLKTYK